MKFITEEAYQLDSEVLEEINESTGKSQKNYYISGIFSTPGQKNRNGRIYPKSIWETEVQRYKQEIKNNSVNTLGEWEHPPRTSVDPLEAVMKMVEVDMRDGVVYGKAKILNNGSVKTNQLKSLIDEGMKIGVSSRGVGSVKNGIVENYRLTTWDAVAFPSDYNCNLDGITESLNESMSNLTFGIDINGNVVSISESNPKDFSQIFEKEDINKAFSEKFKEVLSEMSNKLPKACNNPKPGMEIGAIFSYKDQMSGQKKTVKKFFASKLDAKGFADIKKYEIEAVGPKVR